MPTANPDQLRDKAQAIRKKLEEKGESMDGTQRRKLGKRIRRLQRKRRRIVVRQAQSKPKAAPEENKGS